MDGEKSTVVQLDHPLVTHFLALLRDVRTPPTQYRNSVHQLASLLAYEAMYFDSPPTEAHQGIVGDPGEEFHADLVMSSKIALIAILRGGSVMATSISGLLPASPVVHIGVSRIRDKDEDKDKAGIGYHVIPESLAGMKCWLLDTVMSTGKSMKSVIKELIENRGVQEEDITIITIVAASDGVDCIFKKFPKMKMVTCSVDRGLNKKHVVPGIGNSGARIFQIKNEQASG